MDFVNLHGHSIFSIRDSIAKIDELVNHAVELKYPALALTDHGTMGGLIEFYQIAKEKEVKPILGVEIYMATRSRIQKESGVDKYYHLTLLAMNKTGWSNLCRLVTESYKEENFYYKPRIDRELLRKYNEGLICLSGCLAGNLAHSILADQKVNFVDEEGNSVERPPIDCAACADSLQGYCQEHSHHHETFRDVVRWHKSVFGDRYYLEIQNHYLPEEKIVRDIILDIAQIEKIKVVATGDTHFVQEVDVKAHNIMLAIRDGVSIKDEGFSGYNGNGYELPDTQYLQSRFSDAPYAITNTLEIAERCNVKFKFGDFKLPHLVNPKEEDSVFVDLVKQGLEKRFGKNLAPDCLARAEEEMRTIIQMTFPSYFIIVADYVGWARSKGIPVGPGRGSAAGSLVAYALGITDVDPIKYGLSFSRFLNKGRSSLPLIDFPEYPLLQWKVSKTQ